MRTHDDKKRQLVFKRPVMDEIWVEIECPNTNRAVRYGIYLNLDVETYHIAYLWHAWFIVLFFYPDAVPMGQIHSFGQFFKKLDEFL